MPTGDTLTIFLSFFSYALACAIAAYTVTGNRSRNLWVLTAVFCIPPGVWLLGMHFPFNPTQALPYVNALVPVVAVSLAVIVLRDRNKSSSLTTNEAMSALQDRVARLEGNLQRLNAVEDEIAKMKPLLAFLKGREKARIAKAAFDRLEPYMVRLEDARKQGFVGVHLTRPFREANSSAKGTLYELGHDSTADIEKAVATIKADAQFTAGRDYHMLKAEIEIILKALKSIISTNTKKMPRDFL